MQPMSALGSQPVIQGLRLEIPLLRDAVERDLRPGVAARQLDRGAEAQQIPLVTGVGAVRQHGEALPAATRLERCRDIEEVAPFDIEWHEVVQHDMDAAAAIRPLPARSAEQPAEAFENRAIVPRRAKTLLAEPARPTLVGEPHGERPCGEPGAAHAPRRLDGEVARAGVRPLKGAPVSGQHAPMPEHDAPSHRALDGAVVEFRPQPLALDAAPDGAGLFWGERPATSATPARFSRAALPRAMPGMSVRERRSSGPGNSSGRITTRPSGFSISAAILARSSVGPSPTEQVRTGPTSQAMAALTARPSASGRA